VPDIAKSAGALEFGAVFPVAAQLVPP